MSLSKAHKALADKAIKSNSDNRVILHEAASEFFEHALVHGDYDSLQYLIDGMGKQSQTRHRIAAAVRQHSLYKDANGVEKHLILVRIDKKTHAVTVSLADGTERTQERITHAVAEFRTKPYFEAIGVVNTPAPYELAKSALQFVRNAKKHGQTEEQVLNEVRHMFKVA